MASVSSGAAAPRGDNGKWGLKVRFQLVKSTAASRSTLLFAATVVGMEADTEPTWMYLGRVVANNRVERRIEALSLFLP